MTAPLTLVLDFAAVPFFASSCLCLTKYLRTAIEMSRLTTCAIPRGQSKTHFDYNEATCNMSKGIVCSVYLRRVVKHIVPLLQNGTFALCQNFVAIRNLSARCCCNLWVLSICHTQQTSNALWQVCLEVLTVLFASSQSGDADVDGSLKQANSC